MNEKRLCDGLIGNNKGMVLIFLYLMLAVLTILLAAFMSRSINENQATLRNKDIIEAYSLAQSGIDLVTRDIYELFDVQFIASGRRAIAFAWFDDLPNPAKYVLPVNSALGSGTFTVNITNVDISNPDRRDLTLVSTAQVNSITKQITSVIRYSLSSSEVFEHSYFINNFGWYWGNTITSNGDIRANGDFSFMFNPKVNGHIHAAANPELGAPGDITGTNNNDSIITYRTNSGTRTRPTNPSADPADIDSDGIIETFEYKDGYDGTSQRFEHEAPVDMPYLGDLQEYKDIAVSKNGMLNQGGITLITNVYNGNIILTGTVVNPIVLNGPVVVTGDVLIKGVVTGQGTIYSGRNTHITGNITYQNPPVYAKPDTSATATDTANNVKDFLGLAAKGNIVIGDYTAATFVTNCKPYLKPPFTQDYKVDATDADIGYVSYTSGSDSYFDGDYTKNDGGQKKDALGNDSGNRRYYESSFKDNLFQSYCDAGLVSQIDAVCYTNHAFTGRVSNLKINGTIVARDEAIVYNGTCTLNYDIRTMSDKKGGDLNLPRVLLQPATVYMQGN